MQSTTGPFFWGARQSDDQLTRYLERVEARINRAEPLFGTVVRREPNRVENHTNGKAGNPFVTRTQVKLPMVLVQAKDHQARLIYTKTGNTSPWMPRNAAVALATALNPTKGVK